MRPTTRDGLKAAAADLRKLAQEAIERAKDGGPDRPLEIRSGWLHQARTCSRLARLFEGMAGLEGTPQERER